MDTHKGTNMKYLLIIPVFIAPYLVFWLSGNNLDRSPELAFVAFVSIAFSVLAWSVLSETSSYTRDYYD